VIREYTPADAAVAARLWGEVMPEKEPPTPDGLAHWIDSHPERAQLRVWIAEEAGEPAGIAFGRFNWTVSPGDTAWTWAGVAEPFRGRGIGAALFKVAAKHTLALGARVLDAFALENSPGQRFAVARGFVPTRREHVLRARLADVDLAALPALADAKAGEGFRVVPLRAVDELDGLHDVYASASADIPADYPEADVSREDFQVHVLDDPSLDPDASVVVLEGDRPVSLAFLTVDRERGTALSEMTGTLPEYRGRGLGRLAKLDSMRAAKEQGFAELVTENDAANEAMLGLNQSLGFRITATRVTLFRDPARWE
jgi:GNAT superfamily N-acetyltransferase